MLDRTSQQLRDALAVLRKTAHLMVGVPDYARYVAHRRARHPDAPVMSRAEFVRERMIHRYEGGGSGRCC